MRVAKTWFLITIYVYISCLNGFGQSENYEFKKIETEFTRDINFFKIYTSPISGFTWFCTNKGFYRFDGNDFILSKKWNISNQSLCNFTEDSKGNFYLWDTNDKLSYLDVKTNKVQILKYSGDSLFNSPGLQLYITGMVFDHESIWIGMPDNRILEILLKQKRIIEHKIPSSLIKKVFPTYDEKKSKAQVTVPVIDSRNNNYLWMGTVGIILLFDKTQKNFIDAFPAYDGYESYAGITKIDNCGNDSLMVSTGSGLAFFDKSTKQFTCYPYNKIVLEKHLSSKNLVTSSFISGSKIYLTFLDTLPAIFDITNKTYHSLAVDQIGQALYTEKNINNSFWFIDNNNKLVYGKKKPGGIKKIDVSMQSLPNAMPNYVYCIYWDSLSKELYTGLIGGDGLTVFPGNLASPSVYGLDVSGLRKIFHERENAVTSLVKFNNEVVAIGTDDVIFSKRSNDKLLKPLSLKTDYGIFTRAEALYYDDGLYIVDSLLNLLFFKTLTDKGHIITNFPAQKERIAKHNYYGQILKRGNLIYFRDPTGFYCFNLLSNNLEIPGKENIRKGVQLNKVGNFEIDDLQNLWIIDGKRNLKVFTPSFEDITKQYVNPNSVFFSLCRMNNGNIVASCEGEGLLIFDPAKKSYKQISVQNGLGSNTILQVSYFNHSLLLTYPNFFELIDLSTFLIPEKPPVCYVPWLKLLKTDSIFFNPDTISLRHDENFFTINISSVTYDKPEQIIYQYRMQGLDTTWMNADHLNRNITYSNLNPGKYFFMVKAKAANSDWSATKSYTIIIRPAFWQTVLFKILLTTSALLLIYFLYRRRINAIRKKEQQKATHEKQLLELEAKALRAQMNPHFIFNSMNSIKSLINKNENEKAVNYLTTFSKLIRTLFNNSDKREISLYEELETCKLYTQLEKMRFGNKVDFLFFIDEMIDLKDFKVPALILQPFIENAIWHGLIPKETGGKVTITVMRHAGFIQCTIDDDGIGRERSKQFKPQYEATYQSKGIGLTQSRLELDKLLNEREDAIYIIDKEDEDGKPGGTKVIISFKENRN